MGDLIFQLIKMSEDGQDLWQQPKQALTTAHEHPKTRINMGLFLEYPG